jgi:hypothetical protein
MRGEGGGAGGGGRVLPVLQHPFTSATAGTQRNPPQAQAHEERSARTGARAPRTQRAEPSWVALGWTRCTSTRPRRSTRLSTHTPRRSSTRLSHVPRNNSNAWDWQEVQRTKQHPVVREEASSGRSDVQEDDAVHQGTQHQLRQHGGVLGKEVRHRVPARATVPNAPLRI